MVIYANQTLRSAYSTMMDTLKKIQNDELENLEEEIVPMEKIFELQKMYDIKNEEKGIKEELRKLGYVD